MSQLAIVSTNPQPSPARAAQSLPVQGFAAQGFPALDSMAHDLRNLLATVGLHLETLQRLSGPSGAKAADAAHALLMRGATLCNAVLDRTANADGRARRKGVDPTQVARQIADLLAPTAPKDFSFDIEQGAAACVLADPDDLFRVLFNLMSNAVGVANREPGSLKTVRVGVGTGESLVSMQIADDGPGLPTGAREGLFARRVPPTAPPRHGYGLVIARELAERNGGTLTLAPAGKGTSFVLKLPVLLSVLAQDEPRHLGRRAMAL
jgi:signal transduction histidine kinase